MAEESVSEAGPRLEQMLAETKEMTDLPSDQSIDIFSRLKNRNLHWVIAKTLLYLDPSNIETTSKVEEIAEGVITECSVWEKKLSEKATQETQPFKQFFQRHKNLCSCDHQDNATTRKMYREILASKQHLETNWREAVFESASIFKVGISSFNPRLVSIDDKFLVIANDSLREIDLHNRFTGELLHSFAPFGVDADITIEQLVLKEGVVFFSAYVHVDEAFGIFAWHVESGDLVRMFTFETASYIVNLSLSNELIVAWDPDSGEMRFTEIGKKREHGSFWVVMPIEGWRTVEVSAGDKFFSVSYVEIKTREMFVELRSTTDFSCAIAMAGVNALNDDAELLEPFSFHGDLLLMLNRRSRCFELWLLSEKAELSEPVQTFMIDDAHLKFYFYQRLDGPVTIPKFFLDRNRVYVLYQNNADFSYWDIDSVFLERVRQDPSERSRRQLKPVEPRTIVLPHGTPAGLSPMTVSIDAIQIARLIECSGGVNLSMVNMLPTDPIDCDSGR